jgi:hypothetical protein
MPRANIQQLRPVPLACPEPAEGFHRYAQFKTFQSLENGNLYFGSALDSEIFIAGRNRGEADGLVFEAVEASPKLCLTGHPTRALLSSRWFNMS